jgi:hypothetical protein
VCLFFALSAQAQVFVKVDESGIKAFFENNQLKINFPAEISATSANVKIRLEILDAQDNQVAIGEISQSLKRGRHNLPIFLSFGKQENAENLLWQRLRYTIFTEKSDAAASNIIALSEIMPEVFELQVSAPPSIFAGMNFRAHVIALHPFTRQPIKNVEINGDLSLELDTDDENDELVLKAKGKTNNDGFVSLDFKIPANLKLDDGEIKIKGEKNGIIRETDEFLDIADDAFLYLTTDKPIYQPAQKFFARGLFLDFQKRPLADQDLEFEISGENGETVHEGTVKTSRFGVVNIEWQIPADIKLGSYEIEFENDDGEDWKAEFKISRYDLPNFAVNAKSSKPFYLPNENLAEIVVNAEYLFGKPVTKGKVKIVRETERRWNYEAQKYEIIEGETIEGETDAEGKFIAKMSLAEAWEILAKDNWKRFADVKFSAYFTDYTTNRTEQKRFDVRITKEPIHVYFIRQAADPNPKVPFLFYVSAFYADGMPAKADLKIEGNYRDTTLTTKIAEAKTNSYGASKFEAVFPEKPFPEAKNEFNFRITADDRKGNRGTLAENLYISETSRQLRVQTDKTIYLPNQPINIRIFSSEKDNAVFVDVLKNSGIIFSKRVKIENNRGNLTIPFRPDFQGELAIFAHSRILIDDDFENISDSKTILFPNPVNLDLNPKNLKNVYRPNEEARISFNVQNAAKRPTETALGLLVLDKAIEERARAEQLPDNFKAIRKLIGAGEVFGNLTRRDLDNLDITKPISEDLQLAAEFLLVPKSFYRQFFESDSFENDFSRIYKDYFNKKLENFTKVLQENYEKTGEFPNDENDLRRILAASGINFDELRDAWEMPFQVKFSTERANAILTLKTSGADKKSGTGDDFTVKELRFERFRKTQNELNVIFNNYIQQNGKSPQTVEELKAVWKTAGVDFDALRDGWNRPFYIIEQKYERDVQKVFLETVGNLDGENQQVSRNTLVRQKVIVFKIRSKGADGIEGVYDDFEVGSFTAVLEEKDFSDEKSKTEISKVPVSGSKGAIGGTIVDPNGAVIPGATVTATNMSSEESFSAESNDNGEFLLANLPSGKYKVTAQMRYFKNWGISNVVVSSMNLVRLKIMLEVGDVSATVDVSAESVVINQSSSSVSNYVSRSEAKSIAGFFENSQDVPGFTPRVREYFPETLVWMPEIITDKNGRAEVKFRLGDNLTTWKLYAVGSTETGETGLVEREFQTFQPFFAELDPPRILTEGDEIALPVPIRNYTDKKQKVSVSMANNDWSRIVSDATQNIEISANSSQNVIFNFQAIAPVTDGKQRVTALASKEGDAIEKPVTVRPNGKEIVETQANLFAKETAFEVNFPNNALPKNRSVAIKIYPNMLAHIAESVEGLLKRPYGCGEQTTSSTYPNLMILKIEKELNKPIDAKLKVQAREFLAEGYKRLLNYQTDTGFGYWNGNAPDVALTAYVLRFLSDAEDFIEVDDAAIEKAERWLLSQQKPDGSWANNPLITAYVARSLSLTVRNDTEKKRALQAAIEYLKNRLEQTQDAYILANLALIANEVGDTETEQKAIEKLEKLAQNSTDFSQFWATQNTPFYGWGTTANIETTALVMQAFLKYNPPTSDLKFQGYIARGLRFLLKNKDRYGVWYSTQTTVNVLNTLILLKNQREKSVSEKAEIFINGTKVKEFSAETDGLNKPFLFDASAILTQNNRIEIKGLNNLTMAQIVSAYYIDWNEFQTDSRYFDFEVKFDKLQAKISEEITCSIKIGKKFSHFGMALTEIGLPPGADVMRDSLEKAKAEGKLSSYDVLPDKIVIYFWAENKPLEFNFKFRPRFGLNAQTPASVVYDYYNEEARTVLAPLRFEVK